MTDNAIIASTVRPVDVQPQFYTLQLNGGTEALVTAARPRPLDVTLEAHTISVGPSVETVVNIGAPRKVVSLLQFGTPGADGADGVDADQVELRVSGNMLQWRRVGQVAWNDLLDLTTVVPGTLWGLIGGTLSSQTDLQAALDGKEAAGTTAAAIAAHLLAGDPHPQYLTPAEGNSAYSPLGHPHVLANVTDVTITAANLNTLDDGADTTLHFHAADRARANHTGTQLASTISDFNEAAQDAVGGAFNTTLAYNDAGNGMGRAAITGHISIPAGSNAAVLGSFTMAQLDAAVSDGNVSYAGHTHTLAAGATDVTITAANLNILDDGVDTTLHFHAADRARANHTGSQLASTISDFNEAAQDAVGGAFDTTLAYNDAGNGMGRAAITGHISIPAGSNAAVLGSFTMAQLDAAVSDGNVSYAGHTHTLAAGATDVTITAANLNTLDDGADTTLHFHAADRARANHTGTQLASTISDFSEAVDDRVAALLVAGANVTLTYDDAANTLTVAASGGGGGGLSDGDKGDITVSAAGTVWTIDNNVVSYAKLQDVAANSVLARAANSSGDVSAVALSASQLLGRGSTGDVAAITLGPGLSMSGTTLSASASAVDVQTFTATGTWTKPSSGTSALVRMWAGGGSGGRGTSGTALGGGGGGGAYAEFWISLSSLGSTETATVGAGGAAQSTVGTAGNAGGNSTFAGKTAYGGAGGRSGGGTAGSGGGGGGLTGAGSGATGGTLGGANGGTGGGVGGSPTVKEGGAGGGCGGTNGTAGGGAYLGGAGGGASGVSTAGSGGVSQHGGNGGAGGTAGGTDGASPGGGGGGGYTAASGKGGDGRIEVYVF